MKQRELTPLGEKIKYYRELRGLSQKELSDITGLNKSYMWGLEKANYYTPTSERIRLIGDALGVSLEDLVPISKETVRDNIELLFDQINKTHEIQEYLKKKQWKKK